MTSRERILKTINFSEPDRIPVDLGATTSSGISAIAHNNLKKHLKLDSHPTLVYDVIQQLAQPESFILDMFDVDVVDIGRAFNIGDKYWQDTILPDGSKAKYPAWFNPVKDSSGAWNVYDSEDDLIAKMLPGSTFYYQTFFPLLDGYPTEYNNFPNQMKKVMWSAIPKSPKDHGNEPDFWEQLRKKAIDLREKTGKAIIISCGCNLFELGTFLRRFDNFLLDIAADQKNVERLLEALMEIHLVTLENICNAVGDVVDIAKFGDDLGMLTGPFMSPETYRKLFKPHHSVLCNYVKKNSNMTTFLHSCGSIYDLLPDLIDAGFEIINPVQTNCKNMEPEKLKSDFGKDIVFWGGGVDHTSVLNKGKPEDVRKQVIERLEIFAPGGGYVFNTIHNILPEVPPENIIAMFEAVKEFNGEG